MIATGESIGARARVGLSGAAVRAESLRWLGLVVPMLVSALLNLWNLAQNGYSNAYYSVAVQSMTQSWNNFFFASYDAGGFITVDKPPVALWIQAISAKIFGFSSLSLLVPEAMAGVACVAIVYYLVKRVFGSLAAFVAGLAMAVTPIAVAVERGNNTDTWLMFFLLLAAWALVKATEKGRLGLLVLSMALVGVAFNVKMLAAFVVLPAFYLLYLVAAPLKWYKRLAHLAVAGVVLLAVSFSWATAVQLTPADQRPWIGGSQANSVFDLAFNYNGLGRVTGNEGNTPGSRTGQAPEGFNGNGAGGEMPAGMQPPTGGGTGRVGGNNGSGMFGAGVAGPLRLFGSELASQWSWLVPLGLAGLVAVVLGMKRRLPLERKGQALLLWGGWLALYGVVFSMAEGIFHVYYLIMLAPAAAALVGVGVAALWQAYRKGGWQAWLLPAALLATAAWQVKVLNDYNDPEWSRWLVPITVGGSVVAAAWLVASRLPKARVLRKVAPGFVAVGLLAALVAPVAWSTTPLMAAGNGIMPQAGPSTQDRGGFGQGGPGQAGGQAGQTAQGGQAGPGGEQTDSGLISYLEANQGDYFYLVAVSSANQASSIVLETGKPVLAMGGFTGSDPAMSVEKLQAMIANKQVRYILIGGGGPGGGTSAVTQWVETNFTAVDSSQYSSNSTGSTGGMGFMGGFGGGSQLYDLTAKKG